MNDSPPPFDSPGQLDFITSDLGDAISVPHEDLYLCGVRNTQVDIHIVRSTQYNPQRDAVLLHAHLSTALDPQAWGEFVKIVITENQDQIMSQVMKMLNDAQGAYQVRKTDTPTARGKKSKEKPPAPEEE